MYKQLQYGILNSSWNNCSVCAVR